MRSTTQRSRRAPGPSMRTAVLAIAAVLALPGVAAAAVTKPEVVTKAASNVAQSSATLNASVDPNGAETVYFFQFGPTSVYGTTTPEASAGKGTRARNVSVPVEGLAPATTYHYRIVARNSKGLVKGKDRTFTTRRQPLGLVLTPTENPVRFNSSTVLSGQLTGTGNGGRQVVLQANPFPYTAGFQPVGNPLVTDDAGAFAFPLLGLQVNTQYRVQMPSKPAVVSPIVSLGVKVRVHTKVRNRKLRKGRRTRFSGTIVPAADGAQVLVQRLRADGTWVNHARTVARHLDGASSSFRRRAKMRRSGRYRVFVDVTDGAHVSNHGRSVRVRVRR